MKKNYVFLVYQFFFASHRKAVKVILEIRSEQFFYSYEFSVNFFALLKIQSICNDLRIIDVKKYLNDENLLGAL